MCHNRDERGTVETLPQVLTSSELHPGRPSVIDLDQLDEIVKFKAQGISDRKLADLFGVSAQTIGRHLKSPYAQEKLATWREIIRSAMLRGIAEGGVDQVLGVMKQAASDGDAKSVDAAARALMNLEKTGASASGESKKVEMTGKDGAPLQIDVRALIAKIVEHNQ